MNILRTLATVSSLTIVSPILAYARDFFVARTFGAGLATEAFFIAFKMPNLLAFGLRPRDFSRRAAE
jgi:putative peptidoglycan lipid II flippase